MSNTQTAIKEAIFALEHGNKTWEALDILKAALAESVLPPRLTEEEMMGIQEKSAEQLRAYIYGKTLEKPQTAYRLVEAVVRKQWAKHLGVSDE